MIDALPNAVFKVELEDLILKVVQKLMDKVIAIEPPVQLARQQLPVEFTKVREGRAEWAEFK